ncbi:MAG TPA: 30S ribosomal protein S13 [Deltaproteobacteria bacterium]|nr:MAG: 30S ribosomal protein S13 [Deltaproteobacteria bacterium GWA2_55_82]OGQ65157.1 MAG: 30S ribosomal protein S13 [Deltaproteobacteria bacterium RIFCSPLOWO2_02_FULL_55_12]OIJ74717.1 MAG: 30S ribosomal protein S13 [Deltaproteobacteria bacterium GWC2_55_46]HBG45640.1 30S ribosomal protein S13 [Deltaproteobacteria bacterium]HCY12167.1 30S ribosomal protein S13 [Deltaproteobacteria bacterium]
MARIAGVDLKKNKRIDVALTQIYGVGQTSARKILEKAAVEPSVKVQDLTEPQVAAIRKAIDTDFKVEGDLRKEVSMHVKMLIDMGCYRGIRHRKNLPVRGQRTHTNARTRKGPRKGVVSTRKSE